VEPHPIRLRVEDDLQRSRLTVFFRLLLAIPHLIWLFLWTIAVVFVAIAAWVAVVATGRTPVSLHRFLSAYIRYAVHVNAYVHLAADPFPLFTGEFGQYPVDLETPEPGPQRRWTAALRLVLAVPALLLAGALIGSGGPWDWEGMGEWEGDKDFKSGGGVAAVAAFLGWFAILALGRMPRGLRDAVLYSVRYTAQTLAYLLFVTERYPNADPADSWLEAPSHPVALSVGGELRRSRLTVFFRLLLAIPHFVWITLWGVAALVAAVGAWFAALATGRVPGGLHRFLGAYVRYGTHLSAYLFLVGNPFPPFTGAAGGYPVDLVVPEPEDQPRWKTALRLILALPAFLLAGALGSFAIVAAILGWFAALILGRIPEGLRNAAAYSVRYSAQANAYLSLLTPRYPHSGPPA
jgi:hypothetical protein